MRISLLLQREPFGSIFEKTVADFLKSTNGTDSKVRWISTKPHLAEMRQSGQQAWLCNIYLNAIFSEKAQRSVFEPIYHEFSRSTQWWKRPLQRLYVDASVWPMSRPHLAQAGVTISPPMPNAEHCLFVGGNQKIRLLDTAKQTCFGILKSGFASWSIEHEVSARQIAAKLGLPVPNLQKVAPDGSWFQEAYVVGTPLNRLPSQAEQTRVTAEAFRALRPLWESTAEEKPVKDVAAQLKQRIQSNSGTIEKLSETARQELQRNCALLCQSIEKLSLKQPTVLTALTHGDFQPANILSNAQGIWLIDWEYAERRFAEYDEFVFGLQARSPGGLADRLNAWVQNGVMPGVPETAGLSQSSTLVERNLLASLFLLEELALHTAENSNPQLTQLGQGLTTVMQETNTWLQSAQGPAQ